jgi:hypothetical protein
VSYHKFVSLFFRVPGENARRVAGERRIRFPWTSRANPLK